MLILLPPSETKRDGGAGAPLDLSALSFSTTRLPGGTGRAMDAMRKRVLAATVSLARTPAECAKVLKLSPKQMFEVERNQHVLTSPTMTAIDRYTGVLFDGLDATNLPAAGREFLGSHVLIQSALLGPVGALDLIPAYRLSFDSRLPKLSAGALKNAWAIPAAKALTQAIATPNGRAEIGSVDNGSAGHRQLVLDLRSEGYAALAPLPVQGNVYYLRVVTRGTDGAVRALNHFNKKGKGEFLRALALDATVTETIDSLDELLAWAAVSGITLELGAPSTPSVGSTLELGSPGPPAVRGVGSVPGKPAELNLVVSGIL